MMQVAPAVEIKYVSVQGVSETGDREPKMGPCIVFFEWENAWPGIFPLQRIIWGSWGHAGTTF